MAGSGEFSIRKATPADAAVCGRIAYDAFHAISAAHGFPCDFPDADRPIGILTALFAMPSFYCVVAEADGKLLGSNCLDERSPIFGVGPITVDPATQNKGVGRALMDAVMARATEKQAAGVRLVQAGYHNRSLSLYASLGFDIREPLAVLQGTTRTRNIAGCAVRKAEMSDIPACNTLARTVHGFDRGMELGQAIEHGTAKVVERGGRITGYASSLAFFGHAVAESNLDLQALLASEDGFAGPGILFPTRNSELFRWCLAEGLRVVETMTLMSIGLYNEPAGAWLPSVMF